MHFLRLSRVHFRLGTAEMWKMAITSRKHYFSTFSMCKTIHSAIKLNYYRVKEERKSTRKKANKMHWKIIEFTLATHSCHDNLFLCVFRALSLPSVLLFWTPCNIFSQRKATAVSPSPKQNTTINKWRNSLL